MMESKKAWVTPELIVLVQSKPEEAVLDACKEETRVHGGPGPTFGGCYLDGCPPCNTLVMS